MSEPETKKPEVENTAETKDMHLPDRPEREHDKDDDMGAPIFGATSFAELDAAEQAAKAAQVVRRRADQLPELIENVMADPGIEDKAQELTDLGVEFGAVAGAAMTERKEKWQPLTDAVVKAIKPLFGKKEDVPQQEEGPENPPGLETKSGFTLWKDKAIGGYRWLAIYSNNVRDVDSPPEIISEASHLRFTKMVNDGELPYPELWLWHIDGTKWGVADFVTYDDQGFALASGPVDKGKEWVAETLMASEADLLTSHGMPRGSVKRSADDPTIIVEHTTKEISPLLAEAAANKFTGFSILDEVKEMAMSEDAKLKVASMGLDPAQVEADIEDLAKQTEELEKKQAETPEAATDTGGSGDHVGRDEVAELVKSVAASTSQLVHVVGELAERVKTLEVGKLTIDKDTLEATPAASLADLYKSVIGAQETQIDGRSSLARSAPAEPEPEAAGSRFGGSIATVISQRNREIEQGGVQ